MKVYRYHPCADRHTSWPSLAACIWPHAAVDGDGQYSAVTCGALAVTLFASLGQARARTYSHDRDGCRPGCYRRHSVIALDPDAAPQAAPRPTPLAASPAAPEAPVCGKPRTNGQPCRRPAGWGADPGEKQCRDHGGSTSARLAEKERQVDQALAFAQFAQKARTCELTADEERQLEAAARSVFKGRGRAVTAPVVEVPGLSAWWLGFLGSISVDGGA
ncbi:hypothetical protein [Streptomyces mirabilis]|uniref:hypothetical protein n=1 Tax=Streptomyces mirabilis TaxID=68239 RepID=UPI003686EDB7